MRVEYIDREEFLQNRFDYEPGQHLNIISPTGAGKSHLMYQLAEQVIDRYPDLDFCSFMPKPRDATTRKWMSKLNLAETEQWPPKKKLLSADPNGYVFWPKHILNNEAANREHLSAQFRNAINRLYTNGNSIAFADDAFLLGVIYKLNPELTRHWVAGRSMGASLWTTLQKPSGTLEGTIPSFAYDSPTHMLFGKDTDARNLNRISEIAISQFDPSDLKNIISNLRVYNIGGSAVSEMLYLNRSGPYAAIIGV